MNYESTVTVESETLDGVRFSIRRMSFGRRLELTRQVQHLLGRLEFAAAGEQGTAEQAEAALLSGEIDRKYLRWGLQEIEGLVIDGEAATPELLVEKGPESLLGEVLAAIRREAGLDEDERKN